MSVPIYPRIIHASRVDDTTIHMDASVFYAGGSVTALYPVVFKENLLDNVTNWQALKVLVMNNTTNMLSSVIPSHTQATIVDTSITLAWTSISSYTTEAINSHTKYDMLLLAVGAYDSPSGQEAFGFDFARVTRSPEVIKTSSSMRDPYIVTGTVDATAEAEGITVNADVKNDAAEAYAYVFAETGDRVLNILERLDYIKDPTKTNAVVRVTIPNTGNSTIDGTALANVVEYESGDIVPASTVDAAHVYVVGSDQAIPANVRNFGAKFDGQTYEIVAADDNPHVTMGEVTDPDSPTSGLLVKSGTVFSSKASIAGYYVFSFATSAPTGNAFVEPEYLTEANVGTFVDTKLKGGVAQGYTITGSKNEVWYDATNVPPRYQVGYIQTDLQIQRAFDTLNATSMVDVTNASGWLFTPVILAVDTAARYGLGTLVQLPFFRRGAGWTLVVRQTTPVQIRTLEQWKTENWNEDNPDASEYSIVPELNDPTNIAIVTDNGTKKYHMRVEYSDITFEFKQALHPFTTPHTTPLANFQAEKILTSPAASYPYDGCMSISSAAYDTVWDLSPSHEFWYYPVGQLSNSSYIVSNGQASYLRCYIWCY